MRRGALAKSISELASDWLVLTPDIVFLPCFYGIRLWNLARAPRRTARKKGSGYENGADLDTVKVVRGPGPTGLLQTVHPRSQGFSAACVRQRRQPRSPGNEDADCVNREIETVLPFSRKFPFLRKFYCRKGKSKEEKNSKEI